MTIKSKLEEVVKEMVEGGITYKDAVEEFQKHFILAVLKQTNGNLSKAASELGVHRNTLSKQVGNYFQNGHMAGARLRRDRARKAAAGSKQ